MNANITFVSSQGNVYPMSYQLGEKEIKLLQELDKNGVSRICNDLLQSFATTLKEDTPQVTNILIQVVDKEKGIDLRNTHQAGKDFEAVYFRVYRFRTLGKDAQMNEVYRSYSSDACKAWILDNLGVFDRYLILCDAEIKEILPKSKK